MPKKSAGILLYRFQEKNLQVLLVHPGGPYWAKKDEGAWMIPKGEFNEEEEALTAARREFQEETGFSIEGDCHSLDPIRQKGGKIVYAWACAGDLDPAALQSNTFEMEWPPRSGRQQTFPEVDRAAWFGMETAGKKILTSQGPLLDQLQRLVLEIKKKKKE